MPELCMNCLFRDHSLCWDTLLSLDAEGRVGWEGGKGPRPASMGYVRFCRLTKGGLTPSKERMGKVGEAGEEEGGV